jgi:hypothetical protein
VRANGGRRAGPEMGKDAIFSKKEYFSCVKRTSASPFERNIKRISHRLDILCKQKESSGAPHHPAIITIAVD